MLIRVVLVGMMAGLSLGVPGRREVGAWGRATQCWVNARMADWEAGRQADPEPFVFVPTEDVPAPAPAAAPAVVAEVELLEGDELEIFDAPGLPEAPAPQDTSVAFDRAFQALGDELAETFVADLAANPPAPGDPETIVLAESADIEADCPDEGGEAPVAVADRDAGFDAVVESMAVTFAADRARLAEAAAPAPTPAGSGDHRLARAVRLTREAVVAWASLLHGPAVVTTAP